MLTNIYPRGYKRLVPLQLFWPHAEGFARWLVERGYPRVQIQRRLRRLPLIEQLLLDRGFTALGNVAASDLLACGPATAWQDKNRSAAVHSLVEYLSSRTLLRVPPLCPSEALVAKYEVFLRQVRDAADSTRRNHAATARELLEFLDYDTGQAALGELDSRQIEAFVLKLNSRLSRASAQHAVAHLRSFLRYLSSRGLAPFGLDKRIDTPRLYRGECLPRALPWDVVRAFLEAIDRTTPKGKRDYAMFLLMATYGLRNCEVASLRLEDIEWRGRKLHVRRSKTRSALVHPLTDEVGAALVEYIREARSAWPQREVFLRSQLPIGGIGSTAVTEAFQSWVRRSKLPIPYYGAHCLRHSLAIRLLRQGANIKTIGDLLGHRSAESTCVYLRLHVEDLRGVALDLPQVQP